MKTYTCMSSSKFNHKFTSWENIYSPRLLPYPILQPSTKFTFVIVKEKSYKLTGARKLGDLDSKSSFLDDKNEFDSDEGEYYENDDFYDDPMDLSGSSPFHDNPVRESIKRKSDEILGLYNINEDQFDSYFSINRPDDKSLILGLFKSSKNGNNKDPYMSRLDKIVTDEENKGEGETSANIDHESDDEFSMSEE
jgi:hypothetical protein